MLAGFVVVTVAVALGVGVLSWQIWVQYGRLRAREVKTLERRVEVAELIAEVEFMAEERERRIAAERALDELRKRLGDEVIDKRSRIAELERQTAKQDEDIELARSIQSTVMDMYGDDDAGLSYAARAGPAALAEAFLERGANPEAVGENGVRPLHRAAWNGQVEVIKVLAAHGAGIDAGTETDSTPLFHAIQGDQVDAAEALLRLGAHVDARNLYGRTPLHAAVLYNKPNSLQMVELLLNHGASIKARDHNGKSALAMAEERGFSDLADVLR